MEETKQTETKKPSNPIAFPQDANTCLDEFRGMTLRDHFAGIAMNSIIKSRNYDNYLGNNGLPVPEFISEQAYMIADAMLKQREIENL